VGLFKPRGNGSIYYFVTDHNMNPTENLRVQCDIESDFAAFEAGQYSDQPLGLILRKGSCHPHLRDHPLTLRCS
jgi:hypothetical protein